MCLTCSFSIFSDSKSENLSTIFWITTSCKIYKNVSIIIFSELGKWVMYNFSIFFSFLPLICVQHNYDFAFLTSTEFSRYFHHISFKKLLAVSIIFIFVSDIRSYLSHWQNILVFSIQILLYINETILILMFDFVSLIYLFFKKYFILYQ